MVVLTKPNGKLVFEARVLLNEGLSKTIQWTRKNLSMIDHCIKKHDSQMKVFAG